MEAVLIQGTGILLCSALYTDLLTGKIPNTLTIGFMLAGISLHICISGICQGGLIAFSGLATGCLLLLPAWLMGYSGAGDVKLFMAVGTLMGSTAALWIYGYSAVFFAAWCSFYLIAASARKLPVTGRNRQVKLSGTIAFSGPACLGFLFYALVGRLNE